MTQHTDRLNVHMMLCLIPEMVIVLVAHLILLANAVPTIKAGERIRTWQVPHPNAKVYMVPRLNLVIVAGRVTRRPHRASLL